MSFVKMQMKSRRHLWASFLPPLIIIIGYSHPYFLAAGAVLFFLVTSFNMLKLILLWMLALGGLSIMFPVLASIILIIVIILFFARIGFILLNIRPFLSGILLYGSLAFLIKRSFDLYKSWDWPILMPYISNYFGELDMMPDELIPVIAEVLPAAILVFTLLQLLTLWSYRAGHTSYVTYGVMGSAPLLIVALLLPFLKIGADFVFDAATEATPDTVPRGADHPGLVEVKGYARTLPSGEVTWVEPHLRTAPDGVITNNLSYKGPQPGKVLPNDVVATKSKPAHAVIGERGRTRDKEKTNEFD